MDTVQNPIETIYAKWKAAVEPKVGKNQTSMNASHTIAKTPYAAMKMMGAVTAAGDLEGNECAIRPAIQIDIYTSGTKALSKAYDIDSTSHSAMVGMRFRRTYGPELVENADSKITRLTSRYSRILGGGDSL